MHDGPNIVNIAALVGDHARAAMLTALMSGKALTATELAAQANITKQTASAHLAKMADAGLLAAEKQGRHRYFRLAAADVGRMLESIMGVAERTGATRVRPGPRDPALRKARVCYDHLAGDLGVSLYDSLVSNRLIRVETDAEQQTELTLTRAGKEFFEQKQIAVVGSSGSRRPLCRACLDWSVRRHHLAGHLGARLLDYFLCKKWAKRVEGTRVIQFSARGQSMLQREFLFEGVD